ncbi:hypothetical protein DPMN_022738, partial [Dreissena polymorpha]
MHVKHQLTVPSEESAPYQATVPIQLMPTPALPTNVCATQDSPRTQLKLHVWPEIQVPFPWHRHGYFAHRRKERQESRGHWSCDLEQGVCVPQWP